MSSFEEDPELEEKLSVDPRELDEEDLQDVQVYKSQKLKALRDEGQSGDHPDWWTGDHAPETMDELAGAIGEDGAVPGGSDEDDEEAEAEAEEEETEEAEESAEESEEEATEEEETQEKPAEEPEPAAESTETTETPESPSSVTSEGVPQVGWSQGVPQTDEIDFDNELIQGLYQRQDQLMETLQAVNQGMSEVEVGGDAIESIQNSLDELNEKVDALAEDQADGDLLTKVEEVHEFLATARDMETKLAELPPLPSEDELIEAGILDKAIEHEGSDNCFTTSVDNRKAALHYGLNQDRLTAFHFSLPSILSESVRNVVEDVLARALFEHAKEEGKTVHPQAPRLRSGFLARHPEYYELTPDSVQERHR